MATCKYLLCPSDGKTDEGSVHADDNTQLVVTFDKGATLTFARDDKAITIEGGVTLKKTGNGDIRFVGGAGIDTSGVTGLSGKLVFDFSNNVAFDINGQANPRTGEMQAGGTLTIRF